MQRAYQDYLPLTSVTNRDVTSFRIFRSASRPRFAIDHRPIDQTWAQLEVTDLERNQMR